MIDIVKSEFDDLKVVCPVDCGNAPKKILLKELNIAFAVNDLDFISDHIIDDLHWNIIGEKLILGKERLFKHLKQRASGKVLELHISNIITHGNTGSVNGKLVLENKTSYGFCNVYNFTSAGRKGKIKEITTYIIEIT